MTSKQYTLVWVPTEKAERSNIPYRLDKKTGKLVYNLPSDLPFGHLEFQGVDISGYFKPMDDDIEYSCRPWMFEDTPRPAVPIEPAEEVEETETE